MKKFILTFALGIFSLANIAQAQESFRVTEDSFEQLQIVFNSGQLSTESVTAFGQEFTVLNMTGAIFSSKEGNPNLPTYSKMIEVPICGNSPVRVLISNAVYDTIDLTSLGLTHKVMPLQPSRSKSDTGVHSLVINDYAYNTDAFSNNPLAMVDEVGIARDRKLARLEISPIAYNPVSNKIIVCRQATITIKYSNVDIQATKQLYERYHSPAFNSGANAINNLYEKSISSNNVAIRYLIVAHSSFHNQLDNFVQWKRRKGFITDIVYTDDANVGTTSNAIANYIKSQYTNATAENPAPTYLLIVGDHEQIPAFTGQTDSDHITDLYFTTWTNGDIIPDCYYGRFSAKYISQLTPQIDKTLMYEQYTFADPSFLDRAVMVAGNDQGTSGDYGYTHADPAMDYSVTHYINGDNGFSSVRYFKNNTSINPNATNVTVANNDNDATVRNYYNQGAGWINYSAHGSATGWYSPGLSTSNVSSMTNNQKFGIMIGNCCLTNKFETDACLGEALLRKNNYCGAVGYIGGSNSTYWYEDFYWAVGLRSSSSIGPTMSMNYDANHLGAYDRICHTHNEAQSQWVATQGALMMVGNMAVQSSTSSLRNYYWEIYHLMGDPSLMPYLTQADTMTLVTNPTILCGTTSMSIQTVPYAYVALTDTTNHNLVACAYADANGMATLTLASSLSVGGYELASSAQQYRTKIIPIEIIIGNGPYVVALVSTPQNMPVAGNATTLNAKIANLGNTTANNVMVHWSTDNSDVSFVSENSLAGNIPAGDTVSVNIPINVNAAARDMSSFILAASTSWSNCTAATETYKQIDIHAPKMVLTCTNAPSSITPNQNYSLNISVSNQGHANLASGVVDVTTDNWLASLSTSSNTNIQAAVGSTTNLTYQLNISNDMPDQILLPILMKITTPDYTIADTLSLIVGTPSVETFENGFVFTDWAQGSHPWQTTTNAYYQGSYSARSNASLTHNQSSEMTITRSSSVADSITFFYKVSSEENYDKFHFYIDGQQKIEESGLVDWQRAAFAVSAGTHTYKFSYEKDGSMDRNSDCVWIDNVKLPATYRNTIYSYDTVCFGSSTNILGTTINANTAGDTMVVASNNTTTRFAHIHVLPENEAIDSTIVVCDSFVMDGVTYTESANITGSTFDEHNCPQPLNINLIVNNSTYDTITVTTEASQYTWNNTTYTNNGTYSQTLQNANGCDSIITLQLTLNSGAGIEMIENNNTISAYPNPTASIVNFSQMIDNAVVYDMNGKKVMTIHNSDTADFSSLPSGVYNLQITEENTIKVVRIVVQR